MGKDEDKSEETDEITNSAEKSTEETAKTEEDTKKETPVETKKPEEKVEEDDKKKNTDKLRKVIKVGSNEEKDVKTKREKPSEVETELNTRDSLEQKRAILQSIKDFDFQIKKNQEDISSINQKIESVSKDLDDLVSLYEIVSEQMNPFVGLSKVTKKRIDALENFTKEIEDLKDRTAELESFAEKSGVRLRDLGEIKKEKTKTIDTDALLGEEKQEGDKIETETNAEETPSEETEIAQESIQPDIPPELQTQFTEGKYQITEQQIYQSDFEYNSWKNLSDDDLDIIIERALGGSSSDNRIDLVIDEFIESLKG